MEIYNCIWCYKGKTEEATRMNNSEFQSKNRRTGKASLISDSCADVKDKIAVNKHGVTVTKRNSTAGKRQHRGRGRKACVARGRSREENRAQTKQDPGA